MSDKIGQGIPRTRFEGIDPILNVADIAKSLQYYVGVLGFIKAAWGETFTSVARDGRGIYLCQGSQGGPGTWVWVGRGPEAGSPAPSRAAGPAWRWRSSRSS